MDLKGSKTAENLMVAFAGESQARNRYTYFSSKARSEGYVQISAIFEETAGHEREHAKRLFKFMTGGSQEIHGAAYPFGVIGTTAENLQEGADGENYEHTVMYPSFAKIAEDEGFKEIADTMFHIANAERYHEKRYLELKANLVNHTVFKKSTPITWRCRNCGYNHEGEEAPKTCPACAHPQAHFEVLCEKY